MIAVTQDESDEIEQQREVSHITGVARKVSPRR